MFRAYSLWLDETRLQEANLYLPSLPENYEPQLLALVTQGNSVRINLIFLIVSCSEGNCRAKVQINYINQISHFKGGVKLETGICIVRGRICPEHRVNLKPYRVVCKINEAEAECLNCAASAGSYKHVIAFLM